MFEVVDYYTDRGVLSTVEGDRPVAEVTDALLRAIAQPTPLIRRPPSGA